MTQQLEQPTTLGSTSTWTAAVRALESKRDDRLFNDPWAEILAGEIGAEWMSKRTPESVVPIVLRTRYFDDFLFRIALEHGIRQIVLVGAGLDTRAYRLKWPERTVVFEIDQPAVLERKQHVLTQIGVHPTCERCTVGVDLASNWKDALTDAGFNVRRPTGWLIEGLMFYLPNDVGQRLLEVVTELSSPGSWLGFDTVNSITLTSPYTSKWVAMQASLGAPWIGTMDDPVGVLAEFGWQAHLTQAGQPEANHGRWLLPVMPVNMPNMPHNWLVTAQKM